VNAAKAAKRIKRSKRFQRLGSPCCGYKSEQWEQYALDYWVQVVGQHLFSKRGCYRLNRRIRFYMWGSLDAISPGKKILLILNDVMRVKGAPRTDLGDE